MTNDARAEVGNPTAEVERDAVEIWKNESLPRRLAEICAAFLKLGSISFGGPIAHLSYLRAEFVTRRRWLEDAAYGDLVALCQFLPGPASSQVVFALGRQRAGLAGAIAASLCFTLPSAALMIAFGYGVAAVGDLQGAGWLHGLKLAAVAVVAQAVWGMGRNLCPDRARVTMCLVSAAILLAYPGAFCQVGVIGAGALVGWWLYRGAIQAPASVFRAGLRTHLAAASALIVFLALLIGSPIVASSTGWKLIETFDSFYRAGSLVFGGGHVVLPLLRAEVVPHGWISDDQFLAGYGAAQAIPGPLFTFSSYLGTVMTRGSNAWVGGLWCLFAIFLPAWLLVGGALPFWHQLRSKAWAQAALRGANAAVVGVLLAALYTPVFTEGVKSVPDVAAALVAFGLLEEWKAPPWIVVLLMAAAGQWILR
ncbi:MAG: chromate efflux transporter [Candidatus Glassbacteria bacterium]